jgi:hypothetical protein
LVVAASLAKKVCAASNAFVIRAPKAR